MKYQNRKIMKISQTGKIIIGILTISQLFIGLFALIWFFSAFMPVLIGGNEAEIEQLLMLSIGKFIIIAVMLGVLSCGVLIFYLVHAGTNKHISTTMKVIWVLLLIFFGSIVEVVYFFMEIVPEKSMTGRIEQS